MPASVLCPECEGELSLDGVMVGEILPCAFCGVELEVTSLQPPAVALAPTEDEDWGE